MGWNTSAANKVRLLGPGVFEHSTSAALPRASAVFVDGNAWIRRLCAGTTPPRLVARSFVAGIVSALEGDNPEAWIFFDVRQRMLPVRYALWDQRYARPPKRVATAAEIAAASATSLGEGLSWEVMMASTEAKGRMFNMLFTLITAEIVSKAGHGATWVMTRPNSTDPAWVYPFSHTHAPIATYGEAEAQMVMAIKHRVNTALMQGTPVPSSIVLTIDTDIILQLSGICCRNVTVVIAKVWRDADGTLFRVKSKAPAKVTQIWEQINCNQLVNYRSKDDMLWRMFCWLSNGGVDYCSGLGRFGFTVSATEALLKQRPIFSVTELGFTVNLPTLGRALAQARTTKRGDKYVVGKCSGAAAFVQELNNILLCMRYYTWQNSDAEVAGPRYVEYVPAPADASQAVSSWLARPPQLVVETEGAGEFGPLPEYAPHAADADFVCQYLA